VDRRDWMMQYWLILPEKRGEKKKTMKKRSRILREELLS
jgi:hypothetical protein